MKYHFIILCITSAFLYGYPDQGFAWSNEFALIDMEISISTDLSHSRDDLLSVQHVSSNHTIAVSLFIPVNTLEKVLHIFNVKGECVYTFDNLHDGKQRVSWNGRDSEGRICGAGVYILHFKVDNVVVSQNVLFIR